MWSPVPSVCVLCDDCLTVCADRQSATAAQHQWVMVSNYQFDCIFSGCPTHIYLFVTSKDEVLRTKNLHIQLLKIYILPDSRHNIERTVTTSYFSKSLEPYFQPFNIYSSLQLCKIVLIEMRMYLFVYVNTCYVIYPFCLTFTVLRAHFITHQTLQNLKKRHSCPGAHQRTHRTKLVPIFPHHTLSGIYVCFTSPSLALHFSATYQTNRPILYA